MPEDKYKERILALIPAHNESGKILATIVSIPKDIVNEILVIDDCSNDATATEAKQAGATVISNIKREGVGSVIRRGLTHAEENGFSIAIILAGNSKDDGREIPRLIGPLKEGKYDFIQGSRFLKGGAYGGMPLYRLLATKYIHPLLFSFFSGKMITDSTNGFRAIRVDIIKDKRINLNQDWLNKYELEPYIFYKSIKLGYRVKEVAVSKIYPPRKIGYTKMKPLIGWWSILRPIFLLGLGLKN